VAYGIEKDKVHNRLYAYTIVLC